MDRPRQQQRPRWLVYLLLGRVSNLPTVWTNCIVGITLATGRFDGRMTWLLVAISIMYTAGMFLNDAFDQHYDRKVRPERPIPSGDISAASVYRLGFGMLAAGIVLVGLQTGWDVEPVIWTSLLAALIVYYNYRHKSDPLSPLVMAMCRVMIYLICAAVMETALSREVFIAAITLAGYLIGLTYIAKQENLNEVRNLWPLAFLALPLIHFFRGAHLVVAIVFIGWTLYALSFLTGSPRKVPVAVVSLIAGISLLDAMIISTFSSQLQVAIAAISCFVLTLALQRFIPGT
jgi:4-hydroxybenzoate polyprenyltransferase